MHTDKSKVFATDEDGAIAVIVALLLVVLMGFTALGVDVASLYRERAQLQSVSDLTALSAVAVPEDATSRATNALGRNALSAAALETLETGRYLRNPALAYENRFTPLAADNPRVNAVRVVLENDAALHFARIFTTDTHVTLDRTALSSRTGAASFSLDGYLVALGGTSLNDALNLRFGGGATISLGDQNALANADIDLGALLEALDTRTGGPQRNPAEILNGTRSASSIIDALQSVLPASLASRLNALAAAAGSTSVEVAALVGGIDTDLGLTVTDFTTRIDISALDVVKALIASEASDEGVVLNTKIAVPGVIMAQTDLKAGEPPARSGWIALGEEGVQLNRAGLRLKSDIKVQPNLLGNLGVGIKVASIDLPVYTELAGSTATLDALSCQITSRSGVAAKFSTSATPLHPANGTSVAALYLGKLAEGASTPINPASLDFADLLSIDVVIDLPLLPDITIPGITIQARSHATVGTSRKETLSFTHQDVANGTLTKSFGSGDVLSGAVNSLLSPSNTQLRVKPGQQGLVSGLAAPLVSGLLQVLPDRLLTGLAAPLDAVLDNTLASAGVRMGAGELTLTGHHCEPIRLVR